MLPHPQQIGRALAGGLQLPGLVGGPGLDVFMRHPKRPHQADSRQRAGEEDRRRRGGTAAADGAQDHDPASGCAVRKYLTPDQVRLREDLAGARDRIIVLLNLAVGESLGGAGAGVDPTR